MKELLDNPAVVTLLVTVLGGGLALEVLRRFLDRGGKIRDEATVIRAEQREEIMDLRNRLDAADAEEARLEAEIDRWKGLYYEQKESYLRAITELQIMAERLKIAEAKNGDNNDSV